MNVTPGTIEWATQALRNSQQACQRATEVFLAHSMLAEAQRSEAIRAASQELADRVTTAEPPRHAA